GGNLLPGRNFSARVEQQGAIAPSEDGPFTEAGVDITLRTDDDDGLARGYIRAGNRTGAMIIRAEMTPVQQGDEGAESITGAASVSMVLPDSVSVVTNERTRMGIRASNVNTSQELEFLVKDNTGQPVGNVDVNVFIRGTTQVVEFEGLPDEIEIQRTTDADGTFTVKIVSTNTVGTFSLEACVDEDLTNGAVVCESTADIAVSGGVPSAGGLEFVCDDYNIAALRYFDGSQISPGGVNLCTQCTVTVRDNFGNIVGAEGQAVTFRAEVGSFTQSTVTTNDGVARTTWCASGSPPVATQPQEYEPVLGDNNPRDGLVTLLAYLRGEEEYEDQNGDNVYTDGEPYINVPEPFIDANDNNRWDQTETFINAGQGNQFDGPNDQFDGRNSGFIWVSTRVLLTGTPEWEYASERNSSIQLDRDAEFFYSVATHFFVVDPADTDESSNYYFREGLPECQDSGIVDPNNLSPPNCMVFGGGNGEWPSVVDVYFVARDHNMNPMNGTFAVNTNFQSGQCSNQIGVQKLGTPTSRNTAEALPFEMTTVLDRNPGATETPYQINFDWPLIDGVIPTVLAGTYQRFRLTFNENGPGLPPGGCQLDFNYTLRNCPTGCTGAAVGAPFPYLLIEDE
ncbi:MAG: Ig-like domain-containing protein, partial [Myxococcales bacterium]|nr:Ig-like domain-containing protein [Myxococcales bacterium]